MRESIGGLFLIKIMVVFIIVYNAILAIAVNYAMAFRVKNEIINLLEQYEGCRPAQEHIDNYISDVGYYRRGGVSNKPYTIEANDLDNRGTYYKVTTYLNFDFPFVGDILKVNITGETKPIYNINSDNVQCSG
jgi:hypothetical protein